MNQLQHCFCPLGFGFLGARHVGFWLSVQSLNPHSLRWKTKSKPLDHRGSPQHSTTYQQGVVGKVTKPHSTSVSSDVKWGYVTAMTEDCSRVKGVNVLTLRIVPGWGQPLAETMMVAGV